VDPTKWQEEPGYGADVLRLWVSSVDYTGDVLIGPQIIQQMSDMYRKLRGTMRFLLSNLHDWKVGAIISPFIFHFFYLCPGLNSSMPFLCSRKMLSVMRIFQ
jgi:hypothetical protein